MLRHTLKCLTESVHAYITDDHRRSWREVFNLIDRSCIVFLLLRVFSLHWCLYTIAPSLNGFKVLQTLLATCSMRKALLAIADGTLKAILVCDNRKACQGSTADYKSTPTHDDQHLKRNCLS